MTREQLSVLETWIIAIIRDLDSDHIQDTIYRNDVYQDVVKLLVEKSDD